MIETAQPTTPAELDKAAAFACAKIDKAHGKGSIVKLGDRPKATMPVIATGLYGVDYNVLGVGGLPRGRIIEVFGPESSGKTTLALKVVANAQAAGGRGAVIDVEHALDPEWAQTNGVIIDDLYLAQPDSGEEALDIVDTLIDSGAWDVIVVDSVAALVPQAELDGEMGDSHMGLHARLMSQAMRKLRGKVARSGCVLIFINQIREKIGVMFGSPETTTGGRALKFYASIRLDIRRLGQVKEGDVITGNKTKIKAVKNKVAAPFKECECELLYESGFDSDGSVFDAAVAANVVDKSGAWYAYKGERLGQGRANSIIAVVSRGLVDVILKEVRDKADGTTIQQPTTIQPTSGELTPISPPVN